MIELTFDEMHDYFNLRYYIIDDEIHADFYIDCDSYGFYDIVEAVKVAIAGTGATETYQHLYAAIQTVKPKWYTRFWSVLDDIYAEISKSRKLCEDRLNKINLKTPDKNKKYRLNVPYLPKNGDTIYILNTMPSWGKLGVYEYVISDARFVLSAHSDGILDVNFTINFGGLICIESSAKGWRTSCEGIEMFASKQDALEFINEMSQIYQNEIRLLKDSIK